MKRLAPFVLALAACTRGGGAPAPPEGSATPLAGTAAAPGVATVLDFLSPASTCTFGHRGILLDMGDTTMRSRMSAKLVHPDVEIKEHEGATWTGVHERQLDLSFVSPSEVRSENGVVVEARVRGGLARSVSVYLGQHALGTLPLTKGEAKVVSLHAQGATIARGANELLLRFVGGAREAKETHDTLAEIEWVRIGAADGDAPYSAPTRSDAITTVTIGGIAHRGASLRAPGFARCTALVPKNAVLEGFVGTTSGEADAEVRVLVDRAEPRVVGSFHLGGEGAPPWRPVSLPLGDVGTIAAVELVAKQSAKGARVVFGEARITAPRPAETKPPPARGVVIVVLGTAPPKMLSPWGGPIAMPELALLGSGGMVFEAHRATTSLMGGATASMLTGLLPRDHGVSDYDASLAPGVVTIAEAARQAGVVTAMFTANPETSAAFGFARGWETFAARSPTEDAPATAVFDDASRWLEAHKSDRFLVVVHARGGHPPWDAAAEELKDLPPAGYNGSLEPKHAGEMLAKARHGGHPLTDADRERAFALHAKALGAHDAALGRLLSQLRTIGRDGDTTIFVTGDVGLDAGSHVPFLEDDGLDENLLSVPLVVRTPGNPPRARVAAATNGVDIARSALEALGLAAASDMRGDSLWTSALRTPETPEAASLASTTTRFSARASPFVLIGAREREGKLCNLSLEAECTSDVRATHPFAAEALHAFVYDELVDKNAAQAPRVAIDPATAAALRAWGR
ncbi:MAG TPA: sulfatase-like hydrolase/transferase [Labilithrix sp.]